MICISDPFARMQQGGNAQKNIPPARFAAEIKLCSKVTYGSAAFPLFACGA